jgi:hypothetical protein
MKPSLGLVFTSVLITPSAAYWTLLWRNPRGNASIELGQTSQGCKAINHAKGQESEWDPHDTSYCLSLCGDSLCKSRSGYSCNARNKVASGDISSFDVTSGTPVSTGTQSAFITVTANSSTLPIFVTVTAQPSALPARLPKGAEAGIAIGVIVGGSGRAPPRLGRCWHRHRHSRR